MRKALLILVATVVFIGIPAGADAGADDPLRILINQYTADDFWHDLMTGYAEFHRVMRECGATVDRANIRHITDELLAGYDILIMPLTQMTLEDADKRALRSFIRDGGGVLFMVWKDDDFGDNANIEGFSAEYGIRMGGGEYAASFSVADVVQSSPLAGPDSARRVRTMGHFLRILVDPSQAEGVLQMAHNGHFVAAVSTNRSLLGRGRLVVVGDDTIFWNGFIRRTDGLAFARNLITYLASEPTIPDLAVTALTVEASGVFAGDTIDFSTTVNNIGNGDTAQTNIIVILHSWDKAGKKAGAAIRKLSNILMPALHPGEVRTFMTSGTLPSKLATGSYVVIVEVDPVHKSGDGNPANNRRISKPFKVR